MADRIAVLRDGTIVEEGDHVGLLAQGGHYASLVARQVSGLLPDGSARSADGR
jgi:ABC-type multidrug transport system fused ATPase/permease subunit